MECQARGVANAIARFERERSGVFSRPSNSRAWKEGYATVDEMVDAVSVVLDDYGSDSLEGV